MESFRYDRDKGVFCVRRDSVKLGFERALSQHDYPDIHKAEQAIADQFFLGLALACILMKKNPGNKHTEELQENAVYSLEEVAWAVFGTRALRQTTAELPEILQGIFDKVKEKGLTVTI
jgi:hypothetical protein